MTTREIEMIPIDQIHVLNPRVRNRRVFHDMKDNITQVGLKRPITVTRSHSSTHGKTYDLVCGQGRLEAFLACEQSHIPAMVIEASEEQALVMGLVENLARRQHRSIELLHGISLLQKDGYDSKAIAAKTGLSQEYVNGVLNLAAQGEERLLVAVETGTMPVSVAVSIAMSPGNEQQALQEAYESKLLRGQKLLQVQRLIESRRIRGKLLLKSGNRKPAEGRMSARDLVKVYQQEVDRKKLLIRKAEVASNRLLFITEAMRRLLKDPAFTDLLQGEGLISLPTPLASLIKERS